MNLKISPIFAIGILIIIGVLAIALIRGCRNERKAESLVIDSKGLIDKLKQDSVELARKLSANKDTAQFLEGQLSLSHNKEVALTESLDKANDRISILLRKHISIDPNPDTTATLVPNIYIDDCADCFKELDNGQQLVRKYRAEKDNQDQIYKSQLGAKDNRIKLLEMSNKEVTSSYMALIDITKNSIKPKGKLYLSWGVLFQPWPKYAGAGLMYQNKRNMIIGGMWYYGVQGHMVQTTINFPLSLRFR